ncbi:MAG: PP2C family serine/threonine-protein phosphatase [Kofleriaceae bacterium]
MAATPQDEASRVTLDAWLVTDVGVVRDHNEDSAHMEAGKGFFIVADGMGGHAAGEVASAMAVETVKKTLEGARAEIEAFKKAPSDPGRRGLVQLLQNAVLAAHQAVYQRGQAEQDKAGMGTTLDVVLVAGPEAFVAHVGDSRTYLIRDGKSSQITTDHTVAEVLVIEGKLTIEEAQVSPLRTILVNAIGVSADVGVEMAHVTLKKDDRLLLCSDGLHDYFPMEEEIAQRLSTESPGKALEEMVELAKTRGGHDNITGVTVHILDVVDAVPEAISSDSTAPVEALGPNPFADEPTETSVLSPLGVPPRITNITTSAMKQTQPMRAMPDDEPVPPAEIKDGKGEPDEVPTDKAAALKPDGKGEGKDKTDKGDKKKKGKKAKKASSEDAPPPDDEDPTETSPPKEK